MHLAYPCLLPVLTCPRPPAQCQINFLWQISSIFFLAFYHKGLSCCLAHSLCASVIGVPSFSFPTSKSWRKRSRLQQSIRKTHQAHSWHNPGDSRSQWKCQGPSAGTAWIGRVSHPCRASQDPCCPKKNHNGLANPTPNTTSCMACKAMLVQRQSCAQVCHVLSTLAGKYLLLFQAIFYTSCADQNYSAQAWKHSYQVIYVAGRLWSIHTLAVWILWLPSTVGCLSWFSMNCLKNWVLKYQNVSLCSMACPINCWQWLLI